MRKLMVLLTAGALVAGCSSASEQPDTAGQSPIVVKARIESVCSQPTHAHGGGATHASHPANVYNVPRPPADGSRAGIPCQTVGLVNAPGPIQSLLEQRTDKADQLTIEEHGRTYAAVVAERNSGEPRRLAVTYVGHEGGKILVEYAVESVTDTSHMSRFEPATIVMFMNPDKLEVVYREAPLPQ